MQLVVGRVGRAHGLRGEVAVDVRTDDPDRRFAPGSTVRTEPGDRALIVAATRPHSGRLLVIFEGVTDRTAADQLRGALLTVDTTDLPAIDDPDEFYDHQLVGLAAEHIDGTPLGEVADVLHPPGADLLVIAHVEGREVLVPFVAAMVPVVDVRSGRVVIDPPPGLIDPIDE